MPEGKTMSPDAPESAVPYEFPVERGAIRLFAEAMQSDDPAYFGATPLVPPTFLITAWRWAPDGGRAAHGIPRERLLHGEQEFVFHGAPPRAGDTLTVTERVSDRYTKDSRSGKMEFVVITTEFHGDGVLRAEMRSTFIGREPKGSK